MRFGMSDFGLRIAKASAIAGFVAIGIATVGAQQKPADPNDPRVGLKPGLRDAGIAARGMELVSTRPRPDGFFDPRNPAGLAMPGERSANATPQVPAPTPAVPTATGAAIPKSTDSMRIPKRSCQRAGWLLR